MQTATPAKLSANPSPMLFVRKFLRHGDRVASIAPSSRFLSAAFCRSIDPTRPQTILELGAGTGAVTKAALQRMHPRSRLIAVEIDPTFVEHLKSACPRAHVLCSDVRHIDRHLREMNIDRIDVVLNGLPTPSLPLEINRAVFDCINRVGKDAVCSQLTVMPLVYKGLYCRLFEEVAFHLVIANLPPGGVYVCRGLKPDYADYLPKK
jgi:phospholipid N-methyltransferase